jgi:hypothetical protein
MQSNTQPALALLFVGTADASGRRLQSSRSIEHCPHSQSSETGTTIACDDCVYSRCGCEPLNSSSCCTRSYSCVSDEDDAKGFVLGSILRQVWFIFIVMGIISTIIWRRPHAIAPFPPPLATARLSALLCTQPHQRLHNGLRRWQAAATTPHASGGAAGTYRSSNSASVPITSSPHLAQALSLALTLAPARVRPLGPTTLTSVPPPTATPPPSASRYKASRYKASRSQPWLTRAAQGLRTVRNGYAYRPPAYCTYRRRKAGCPGAPSCCTHRVRVPASGYRAPH